MRPAYWRTLLIIAPLMLVYFVFALFVPIFEGPDEQSHFATAEFYRLHSRVPYNTELDMSEELWRSVKLLGTLRNEYGQNQYTYHPEYKLPFVRSLDGLHEQEIRLLNTDLYRTNYLAIEAARYPPLYYQLLSSVGHIFKDLDLIKRLYFYRLTNLTFALIFLAGSYASAKLLFKDTKLAKVLLYMVALHPMIPFLFATLNPDNLFLALSSLVIYSCLLLIKNRPRATHILALVCLLYAAIITKPQGAILIPISGVALGYSLLRHKASSLLLIIAAFILLFAYPLVSAVSPYLGYLNSPNISGATYVEFIQFSSNKAIAQNSVWYWGIYKWLGVVLPAPYWQIMNRVVLLSTIGFILTYVFGREKLKKAVSLPVLIFLVFANVLYISAIYWYDWQHMKTVGYSLGIQARYFYPLVMSQLAILLIGWRGFLTIVRLKKFSLISMVSIFLTLHIGGLLTLAQAYYQVDNLQDFIYSLSHYKPNFAKGSWWAIWASLYVSGILLALYNIRQDVKA